MKGQVDPLIGEEASRDLLPKMYIEFMTFKEGLLLNVCSIYSSTRHMPSDIPCSS
jgi:hypothetical protein